MMERAPVKSSNIKSIGYDAPARILEVEFVTGRIYEYTDVTADVYDRLMSAESIGRVFASAVRGKFMVHEVTWERCVRDRIYEFLALFPPAEYGAASIILSDYKLEDRWFPQVIGELNRQKLDPVTFDPAEIEATLVFLKELQAIPEDQRCPVRD